MAFTPCDGCSNTRRKTAAPIWLESTEEERADAERALTCDLSNGEEFAGGFRTKLEVANGRYRVRDAFHIPSGLGLPRDAGSARSSVADFDRVAYALERHGLPVGRVEITFLGGEHGKQAVVEDALEEHFKGNRGRVLVVMQAPDRDKWHVDLAYAYPPGVGLVAPRDVRALAVANLINSGIPAD